MRELLLESLRSPLWFFIVLLLGAVIIRFIMFFVELRLEGSRKAHELEQTSDRHGKACQNDDNDSG